MVEIKLEETESIKSSDNPLSTDRLTIMSCCSTENCDNFFVKSIEQVACEESSGVDGIFYCDKCTHFAENISSNAPNDHDSGS
jgi:hypothetical protein